MQQRQEAGGAMKDAGAAAVEWLAAAFPDTACSIAAPQEAFGSPADFWAEASMDVESCLAYQDRFASGMDDKIRAAHLIAFYSHQLCLAAGAIYLASGAVPVVSGLRFERYVRSDGGREVEAGRFHFLVEVPTADALAGEERGRRFHDAFVRHMKPIIALLRRRCGLSGRAQWRLAADGLTGAFLEIGRRRDQEAAAIERALGIVKRGGSPLSSPELHYEKVNAEAHGGALARTYRIRSGCCLYYRTEGGDFCDTCVLLKAETRRERLRAHLRASEGQPAGSEVVDCPSPRV